MRLYDYAASGNCFKVRLLLALLDRPYERVAVDIFAGETLTDAFARLNPARETPVLELDDGEVVVQSNAILWYLAHDTAFLPQDALGRARTVQWLFFEQEWIMRGVGGSRFRLLTGREPEVLEQRLAHGRQALDLLEAGLTRTPFVTGPQATIADVSLYAYTHVAADAGFDLAGWPRIAAWLEAVEALPGYTNDYIVYPDNARPPLSRSIYD